MTINVVVPPTENYFYSRAESADKKVAKGEVSSAGDVCTITPADGMNVVILIVSGTAQTAGDSFKVQSLQSGVWTDILPPTYLIKNGHMFFTFPCWKPEQDEGDGVIATIKLVCAGTGAWKGFIMYYEEEA